MLTVKGTSTPMALVMETVLAGGGWALAGSTTKVTMVGKTSGFVMIVKETALDVTPRGLTTVMVAKPG